MMAFFHQGHRAHLFQDEHVLNAHHDRQYLQFVWVSVSDGGEDISSRKVKFSLDFA
jgi:hypothetical protein